MFYIAYIRGASILVATLLLAALPTISLAATRYVRAGSSGAANGIDWTNAYPSLPSTLVRGDTYYVATGNYPGYTFDDAESGTTIITIKKATVADHGTAVGWTDVYGAGQAVFTDKFSFSRGYYTIDGQSRTSPKSGHGIKISNPSGSGEEHINSLGDWGRVVNGITYRFVEIAGAGCRSDNGCSRDYGFMLIQGGSDILIQNCYMHDVHVPFFGRGGGRANNVTIEHNWIARNYSSPTWHSEAMSMSEGFHNLTIRFNTFEDIEGTAYIATPGVATNANSNWLIYGNVMFRNPSFTAWMGDGIVSCLDSQRIDGTLSIVNNTFVNVNASRAFYFTDCAGIQSLVVRNNLWVSSAPIDRAGCTSCGSSLYTHNGYFNTANSTDPDSNKQSLTTDPLVDWSNGDFRLKTATAPGVSFTAPLNRDRSGTIRGGDGIWDRGALEFSASGGRPAPPSNLSFVIW